MGIEGEQLVRELARLRPNLMAYIVSIVGDDHLGEDLLQDVFVQAYEKRDTIRDASHLAGWLRVAARHLALNAVRDRRNKPTLDPSVIDVMDRHWSQFDDVEHSDAVGALRRCVHELSSYAQELVRLRYAEGLSGQRLADRLGRKVTTIYVALTRAHKALAECVRRRLNEGRD